MSNIALPLGSIDKANLQSTSTQISFDPLALLAILPYDRANLSTARLYNQHDAAVFRWPHTMMIGGAIPPFKLLVAHLLSRQQSVHPAVDMYQADTERVEVKSTVSDGGYFGGLHLMHSNIWLSDILSFKPSRYPTNDIMVVYMDNIHGYRIKHGDHGAAKAEKGGKAVARTGNGANEAINPWLECLFLNLISGATLVLLATGLVFSILLGDMWSASLFGVYFLHATASVAVSRVRMVCSKDQSQGADAVHVREDDTIRYILYQRPEGGKVVFKGRQDTLETWRRMAWTFQRSTLKNIIHWSWMITGSFSAAASVTCMVNMRGYLQLAYLGALTISSLLELMVTVIVRHIQYNVIHYGNADLVDSNDKWSKAVIRSALEVDDTYSLEHCPWVDFGLFPKLPVWENLSNLLPSLRENPGGLDKAEIVLRLSNGVDMRLRKNTALVSRMADEIEAAQQTRAPAGAQSPPSPPK